MEKLKQTIGIANKLSRDPKKLWQSAVAKVAGSGDFLNTLLKALDEYGKGKTEDVFRPFFSESENHDFDDDEPSKKHAIDNLIEYVDIFEEYMEIGRAPSELQSHSDLVCRLLLEKKKKTKNNTHILQLRNKRPNVKTSPHLINSQVVT